MLIKHVTHAFIDDVRAVSAKRYLSAMSSADRRYTAAKAALERFETLLVLCIAYPGARPPHTGPGYGLISRHACGEDYHRVFERVFDDVTIALSRNGIRAKGYADTGPFDERLAGRLAGLGYMGKNHFLIHPDYGTFHHLGILLVDQAVTISPGHSDDCGSCDICVRQCPTNALEDGFHREKCLSYWTQAKAPLPRAIAKHMDVMLFGCDICQNVCPKNNRLKTLDRAVFRPDESHQLHLETILKMTNRSFENTYGGRAFAYRGVSILKRNACVLARNQGVRSTLSAIREALQTHRDAPWFVETAEAMMTDLENMR